MTNHIHSSQNEFNLSLLVTTYVFAEFCYYVKDKESGKNVFFAASV